MTIHAHTGIGAGTGDGAGYSESRLQQECYMHLHNHYPHMRGLFFEVHNNANSAISGTVHKAMGRVAGVADMCMLIPARGAMPGRVIFVEFKTSTGRQSPKQIAWQATVERAGFQYVVIRSVDEFRLLVRDVVPPA
jgi:hypothetical protein